MLRLLLQPGQYLVGLIALWGLALPAQALEDLGARVDAADEGRAHCIG